MEHTTQRRPDPSLPRAKFWERYDPTWARPQRRGCAFREDASDTSIPCSDVALLGQNDTYDWKPNLSCYNTDYLMGADPFGSHCAFYSGFSAVTTYGMLSFERNERRISGTASTNSSTSYMSLPSLTESECSENSNEPSAPRRAFWKPRPIRRKPRNDRDSEIGTAESSFLELGPRGPLPWDELSEPSYQIPRQPVEQSLELDNPRTLLGEISLSPLELEDHRYGEETSLPWNSVSDNYTASFSDSTENTGWESEISDLITEIDENHPFYKVRTIIVSAALLRYCQWKMIASGDDQTSQRYATGMVTPSSASSSSRSSRQTANKHRMDNNRDDDDDHDKEQPRKRRPPSSRQSQVSRGKCFACPFAKKNPFRHRKCFSYIISRIQDVKFHLTRYHQRPIFCSRCKEVFPTEDSLDRHAISDISCEPRGDIFHEGVTRTQQDQLRRKSNPKLSDEEQWYEIYRILFGNQGRPHSVYVDSDLTWELQGFVDMMQTDGVDIITRRLEGLGLRTTDHEEHEISGLLSATIADGLHEVAGRWLSSMRLRTPPSSRSGTSSSIAGTESAGPERQQTPSNTYIQHLAGNAVPGHRPPPVLPHNIPRNDRVTSLPSPPAPPLSFDISQGGSSLETSEVIGEGIIDLSDPSIWDSMLPEPDADDFDFATCSFTQGNT